MPDKHNVLQSIVIILLLARTSAGATGCSSEHTVTEQTLKAIKDCITNSPTTWPEEWKQQYLKTIRKAIEQHPDVPHYTTRLEILRKGFEPYWGSFKKTPDRSLFEVHRAQIRWYTEHLMGMKFPSENERKKPRDQYKDIWDYASNSLLAQFPFLDPNAVKEAKAKDLNECYSKIDAPLMPVYLRPMSEEQVEQIKQLWYDLRYARIDLLRKLGYDYRKPYQSRNVTSSNTERDYEFTKESLSQLLGLVWMVVPQRPDYYLSAIKNRNKALELRFKSKRMARLDQQRLENERSRQLLQTEHISFMLATMLETKKSFEEASSISKQVQSPLEQHEKTEKGGDACEVKNGLKEK